MQESVDLWTIINSIIVYGLPTTLFLTGIGLIFGFLLGLILALMRVYGIAEMRWLANGYEKILRGIPILVLMFIFGWGLPGMFWFVPAEFRTLVGVILSLSLRSGAYQSQLIPNDGSSFYWHDRNASLKTHHSSTSFENCSARILE
ncbi:MAG: ABC transporter permease subunit [Candidatus Thorarchaeota archaeon]